MNKCRLYFGRELSKRLNDQKNISSIIFYLENRQEEESRSLMGRMEEKIKQLIVHQEQVKGVMLGKNRLVKNR